MLIQKTKYDNQVYICDKCKKQFNNKLKRFTYKEYQKKDYKNINNYDLCDECYEEFNKWINEKEIKINDVVIDMLDLDNKIIKSFKSYKECEKYLYSTKANLINILCKMEKNKNYTIVDYNTNKNVRLERNKEIC